MLTKHHPSERRCTWGQVLAGDAAVSGGVLPSAVSGNEDAEFAQRVQETPLEMADRPRWRRMMMMMRMMMVI